MSEIRSHPGAVAGAREENSRPAVIRGYFAGTVFDKFIILASKPPARPRVIIAMNPSLRTSAIRLSLVLLLASPVLLPADPVLRERERNQQERIAHGVQSGQLTPAETARLEAREKELNQQIASDRSANGGKLTPAERAQISGELNGISTRIHRQKHDAQTTTAHPVSEVGKRELNQQGRIAGGVASGQLTPAETSRLEAREAVLRKQIADDRSANGGKLTPEERAQINHELDGLSTRIYQQKHDAQTAK